MKFVVYNLRDYITESILKLTIMSMSRFMLQNLTFQSESRKLIEKVGEYYRVSLLRFKKKKIISKCPIHKYNTNL